ncbi:MAG TPA: PLAT/LH2 domain-containing protein [Saprospiraceae bacterium]|nr:PLAT/LH2 domain-containing protein [Saprospiraceae bacterium]
MKVFTTAFSQPSHWKTPSFFVFLLLCLILPNLASAQFVYEVATTTGTNGTDKSVYILLVGTQGVAGEPFELNGPGDDFRHRATNKFTYRSDKPLGSITDIALKASASDHWQVTKVTVTDKTTGNISTFTAFRGKGLIKGEWTSLFRADGLFDASKNVTCCQVVRTPLPDKIEYIANLQAAPGSEPKTSKTTLTTIERETSAEEDTETNSIKNSLNIDISTSYESPVGASVSMDVAYGLEVYNETTRRVNQEIEQIRERNEEFPLMEVYPGYVGYLIVKRTKVTVAGSADILKNNLPFSKDSHIEVDHQFLTFSKDELDQIPEFIIKDKGKPICYTCDEVKKVVTNDNPVPNPSPAPQPVVEKTSTSQVEVCDNGGNVVGYFKKNGNGWVETDTNGNTKFRFSEIRSDQGVIYLSDKDRQGVKINLDTNNKEVMYSDQNNTSPFRIYVISKTN